MIALGCQQCGHRWVGVAAVGTEGVVCPKCGVRDPAFVWLSERAWTPHDGCWLTGAYVLPWWQAQGQATAAQAATTNQDDAEIDAYTGEPRNWVKRWLQRLQTAWWALRGEW